MRTHRVSGLHFDMQVHKRSHHGHREIDFVITRITGRALGSHGKIMVKIKKEGRVLTIFTEQISHSRAAEKAISEAIGKTASRTGWAISVPGGHCRF